VNVVSSSFAVCGKEQIIPALMEPKIRHFILENSPHTSNLAEFFHFLFRVSHIFTFASLIFSSIPFHRVFISHVYTRATQPPVPSSPIYRAGVQNGQQEL
jgi:hypothetical protein